MRSGSRPVARALSVKSEKAEQRTREREKDIERKSMCVCVRVYTNACNVREPSFPVRSALALLYIGLSVTRFRGYGWQATWGVYGAGGGSVNISTVARRRVVGR